MSLENIGNPERKSDDHLTVAKITKHYRNHPSIETINKTCNQKENFGIPTAITEEKNKIIKVLDPKKATGLDKIPPKIVKMSAHIIDSHLANIINNNITKNAFSEKAKVASVRPIFKKNEREKIENYRPVSILNCFSKVYERFLPEKFKPFINSYLSEYMAAYRENYGTTHVLIRLIGNWKNILDEKFLVGTVLMDLSKAFDCIPHDLLITKLHASGFSQKVVTFIYSYLKRRKQKVKVNSFLNDFLTLLSGVPQGSILGPILFNIFLNGLPSTLKLSDLFNFADDNTISTTTDNTDHLLLC